MVHEPKEAVYDGPHSVVIVTVAVTRWMDMTPFD